MKPIAHKNQLITSVFAVLFLGGMSAVAQEPAVAAPPPDAPAAADPTAEKLDAMIQKLEQQQKEIDAIKQESAAQKNQTEAVKEELKAEKESREQLELQVLDATVPDEGPSFRIYGFLDLSFTNVWADYENAGLFATTPRYSTFHQNNINLYFQSEMTDTLETLFEVRFTHQPNGDVNYTPTTVYIAQEKARDDPRGYEVVDTTVSEAYAGEVNLGGIVIERAQFDWKPKDWFNFRVGRYLTPFGIWNENHGSPVILSSAKPFIISQGYVPTAQTGIMGFGRVFPTDIMSIDYALTLSNGRGPFNEFYDVDQNKALGVRAKLNWVGDDWHVKVGGYGYWGKYTEAEQEIVVYLNYQNASIAEEDLRYDTTVDHPFSVDETVTNKYRELILTGDLEINLKGVQLYSEYAVRKVDYIVPTEEEENLPYFIGANPTIDSYRANFIGQAAYVMLAWELPLQKLIGDFRITPFVGYDILRPNDSRDYDHLDMVQFGLNLKPSPFVTLKSTAYAVMPKDDLVLGGNYWYWTNMIAVSF